MRKLLVIFEATGEKIESLSLALGLGAVQHGADLRLRHLSAPERSALAHRGYGRLKVADFGWAECVATGVESKELNPDLSSLIKTLSEANVQFPLIGKCAYIFGEFTSQGLASQAVESIRAALIALGISIQPDFPDGPQLSADYMTQMGNRLADI